MNDYKKKTLIRITLVSSAAVLTAIAFLVLTLYRDQLPALPSFIKGFHIGAFIGLEAFCLIYLGNCIRVIRNEEAMKKMIIAETDERTALIVRNASALGMGMIHLGLGIATIIAGFLNKTVFFSLMGSQFFILIVFYASWVYYARKL
ncbi:hypothetical protein ACX1C1_09775 [Paenibacillus sp. strain BS8-2]